jgi:hypothetical protein
MATCAAFQNDPSLPEETLAEPGSGPLELEPAALDRCALVDKAYDDLALENKDLECLPPSFEMGISCFERGDLYTLTPALYQPRFSEPQAPSLELFNLDEDFRQHGWVGKGAWTDEARNDQREASEHLETMRDMEAKKRIGEAFVNAADQGEDDDVVRMLALGADGVMLGRAWCYALAADGERGVAHMLSLLKDEMRVAMALTGHTSIASIDRHALYPQ